MEHDNKKLLKSIIDDYNIDCYNQKMYFDCKNNNEILYPFKFIYHNYYYNNNKVSINLASNLVQYLPFIVRNPGKQNSGIFAKDMNFFAQAYGIEESQNYQFDPSLFE